MTTLALFDLEPVEAPKPVGPDWDSLDDLAFLYTATRAGNSTGIRFAASLDDAMRWCSSPVSQGVLHGTPWAYFWTSASNFIRKYSGDDSSYDVKYQLDLSGCSDSGEWDARLVDAGVRKIPLWCLPSLVGAFGVPVVNAPFHKRAGCVCGDGLEVAA